jgi:tripartite-type tricarboxylate transporter receptor subunit TctC
MKRPRRNFLHLIAGAATVALVMSPADHEAWSQATRPIRIVVPYPPGGGSDILARLLADQIGRTQGQTILVENRAGAGSAVGTEAVSRSTPDGSTLLINTATIVIGPHLNKLNYDALVSFEPVCLLATTPLVVSVNSASPYRTLAEFLSAARAKAGELSVASVGPGTTGHIAFEKLKRASHVDLTYVPRAPEQKHFRKCQPLPSPVTRITRSMSGGDCSPPRKPRRKPLPKQPVGSPRRCMLPR